VTHIKNQMVELCEGISLAFFIIKNDEYEMQSVDKLPYAFPACLSHDKWHMLYVEQEAPMGLEPFVSYELVVHRKAEATYTF
jgi:hypothetical protein